jgi:hypothetical protein
LLTRPRILLTRPRTFLTRPRILLTRPRIMLTRPRILLTRPRIMLTRPRIMLTRPRILLTRPRILLTRPRILLTRSRILLTRPRNLLTRPRILLTRPRISGLLKIQEHLLTEDEQRLKNCYCIEFIGFEVIMTVSMDIRFSRDAKPCNFQLIRFFFFPLFETSTRSFLRVKRPGSGVDHPPLPASRLKKEWSCTSAPSLGLRCLY